MKENMIYTLMSLLDGISIFVFAFACFKVSFRDYWKEIVVTNLLISFGTFFLKESNTLLSFVPLLCFALLVTSFTFYFRITVWSSFKLAAYGFVAQIVTQFGLVALFMLGSKTSFSEASNEFGFYVQLIGDLVLIGLAMIIQKRRIWFTTMSNDYNFRIKINKINIFSVLIGVVIVGFLYNVKSVDNIYLTLLFWGICLLNLLYIDIKKEKSAASDR